MKPIRKAIFPVGGLGTRFLPATKAVAKEMLPIVDKPMIEYAVDEARAAGIEELIFVGGRGKESIQQHFDHRVELETALAASGKTEALEALNSSVLEPGQIAYVRQMQPLGLGHAVWCARNLVRDEPFAVILADDLIMGEPGCLSEMVEVYNEYGGCVVATMDVPLEHTSRYGILDPGVDAGNLVEILDLVEKPKPEDAPSTLAIVGRYILQPHVMDYLALGNKGIGNEIHLTDSMVKLIGDTPFHGVRFSGTRFDCGTKVGYLEANVAYALQRDDLGADVRATIERVLRDF